MTRQQRRWVTAANEALSRAKSISIENANCLDELTRVSMDLMNLLQETNRHLLSTNDGLIYVRVRMTLFETYVELKRNQRLIELKNIPLMMESMVLKERSSIR